MFYDGVSSAGGTLLISKFVAQAVYDHNTDPNGTDSKTCIGMGLFPINSYDRLGTMPYLCAY
jgi:hypothetical protein